MCALLLLRSSQTIKYRDLSSSMSSVTSNSMAHGKR
jgi:hypothetical protein